MNAVIAIVLFTGGESETIVDRVLPEILVLRIRMATLQEGMSKHEVRQRLGLNGRLHTRFSSTIANSSVTYPIGTTHELTLDFTLKKGERLAHGLY